MGENSIERLVADVGGTNVRFARLGPSGLEDLKRFKCVEFAGFSAATAAYLNELQRGAVPSEMAVAVASPVMGDRIEMTNQAWSFSIQEARRELGLDRLVVVNDFEALAQAIPVLGEEDCETIQPGEAVPRAAIALLGPGTGLGTAGLIAANGGWVAIAAEGGHRDLAPTRSREWEVFSALQARFGHVSVERVLSGPGLANLEAALATLSGRELERPSPPEEIVARAREGSCALARETLHLFSSWLGAVAGDLALTLGALGGVYVGGGVLPKLGEAFDRQAFRSRFVAKGRFGSYLERIPVRLIVRGGATLLGAARLLENGRPAGSR